MRRIAYLDKEEEAHRAFFPTVDFAKEVAKIRNRRWRNKFNVQEYLDIIINFGNDRLLVASVGDLKELIRRVDKYLPDGAFYSKKVKSKFETYYTQINKKLESIFDYDSFMSRTGQKGNRWGGAYLALRLAQDVKFCPYCNAETVESFQFDGDGELKVVKSAFDHFFPLARYPFLGLSLYNLIPACNRCNSRFKLDKTDGLMDCCHPYANKDEEPIDFHDGMKFVLVLKNIFCQMRCNKTDFAGVALVERKFGAFYSGLIYKEIFRIDEVYSKIYLQDAIDVFWKATRYPLSYIDSKVEQLRGLGANKADIERMIYGAPLDVEEINKHRFAKMIIDIVDTYKAKCVDSNAD